MEQKIQTIMNNFNFQAVHAHMMQVGWGWGLENKIPTVEELRTEAERLLRGVAQSQRDNDSHSCGGFHAHKWAWRDDYTELELTFVLEVWDD